MIIDTYENINFYFGMSKDLNAALTILKHYYLSHLAPGEYTGFPDDESNVILKIIDVKGEVDAEKIPWEYHEKYIDVQHVLKGGSELIGYTPRNKLTGWEYDEEKDVAYSFDHSDYLLIKLAEGDFAIFFPQDAHRKVQSSGDEGYHKIVLKVPITGFKLLKNIYG